MKVWLVEVRNEEDHNVLIDIAATEAVGQRCAAKLICFWYGDIENMAELEPLMAQAMQREDYACVCKLWEEVSPWNIAEVTKITVEE